MLNCQQFSQKVYRENFGRKNAMYDTRNFRKEYDAFLQQFPYQTAVVDGIKVRYQYGGKKDAPVLLFFNGLEMQEMWMPYLMETFLQRNEI